MSNEHHDHHHADDGGVHVHVHPTSLYIKVFLALLVFTALTVAVGEVSLGAWNFFIAVVIATIKAALVALFFMHLKDDDRFNGLLFVGSLIFMGVFFVYTMNDTQHRGRWTEYGTKVLTDTGAKAPGGCAIAACAEHNMPKGGGHGGEHGEAHGAAH